MLCNQSYAKEITPVLSMKDVSVSIVKNQILKNINLEFLSGQFTALLGPNGAGKSTALKCLTQDICHWTGSIELRGKPLKDWPREQLAKNLAVLPQHASLSFPFKVVEVVAMGLYPLTLSEQDGIALVNDKLALLDLLPLKQRQYPGLSGGEKQRVQLARVLVQLAQAEANPVILLDEPTSALDLAQQHRVLGLMQKLAKEHGYCVISVLHDLNQAARYADRLVVIKQGQIAADGSSESCLSQDLIEQVWQYRPEQVSLPNSVAYL